MQKSQPHFSSDQRRELVEEHPWMRRGGLPAAINVKVRTRTQQKSRLQLLHPKMVSCLVTFCRHKTECLTLCFQECVYCEDTAAAPLEEDLPDMDMGDMGEEPDQENQNTQNQSEEPQPQLDAGS